MIVRIFKLFKLFILTLPSPSLSLSFFLFVVGLKALEQSAPRDKAILGIKMLDSLKDRLKGHLECLVEEDPSHTITAQDIRTFFENEEAERRSGKRSRLE